MNHVQLCVYQDVQICITEWVLSHLELHKAERSLGLKGETGLKLCSSLGCKLYTIQC